MWPMVERRDTTEIAEEESHLGGGASTAGNDCLHPCWGAGFFGAPFRCYQPQAPL